MHAPKILARPDGSSRTVGGYRVSAGRDAAKPFTRDARLSRLPPRVDLRPLLTAVEDQATTNSCAANATAGAFEYLVRQQRGEAFEASRLFIYWNARQEDGSEGEDEGTTLANVIAALRKVGACSEEAWPFDPDAVNEPPEEGTYEEAAQYVVHDSERVPTDLDAWRAALAAGHPILFGIKLFDSFDRQKRPGLVPAPTPQEVARASHGGHAMLAVGYSDADKVFIVRNSWGTSWGDGGYCYLPYRYVTNPAYNFDDSWILRGVAAPEIDESTWGDDESVLPEIDSFLAELDDEAWEQLLEAMGDVPFEERLALLFLAAAGADGTLGDEELAEAATHLEPLLALIQSPYDGAALLEHALERLDDEALLEETLDRFGELFPADVLATIATQLDAVAGADGASEEEEDFVDAVVARWQLDEGEDDDDDPR